jgi:regulator of protease activity HflC (stomatin/prohibitin superfamily)
VAQAKADGEALQIKAQAQAAATRVAAQAESDAIRIKAEAAGAVSDEFAREMELRRLEVQRVGAYGNRTVFVGDGAAGTMGGTMAQGFSMYRGGLEAAAAQQASK